MSERADTVAGLLWDGMERLRAAGVEEATREARRLLSHALDRPAAALIGAGGEAVGAAQAAAYRALIDRRAAREPVARILGRRGFWTLELAVGPAVLDPRPDSETLVEAALARFPDPAAPFRVVDLGTGSGCLLLAVLAERPAARGLGIDRSAATAAAARANALSAGLGDRAAFAVGDWAAAVAGPVDLVLCNPPYIERAAIAGLAPEVRGHDPALALDGGDDGYDAYRALLPGLARALAPGGAAVLEVGAGQWNAVARLAEATGFAVEACARDSGGIARALVLGRGGEGARLGR